ncbi:hypothetical protein [Mycoplasmopsis felifaucium]|uniref:hypothetical protein n=1 Tax=Mycoplasmopsis felifaucium TaxID=35768 RepID=UPI000481A23A|nr:hypothetical protein [Mycoplasmopsis felifaucium]
MINIFKFWDLYKQDKNSTIKKTLISSIVIYLINILAFIVCFSTQLYSTINDIDFKFIRYDWILFTIIISNIIIVALFAYDKLSINDNKISLLTGNIQNSKFNNYVIDSLNIFNKINYLIWLAFALTMRVPSLTRSWLFLWPYLSLSLLYLFYNLTILVKCSCSKYNSAKFNNSYNMISMIFVLSFSALMFIYYLLHFLMPHFLIERYSIMPFSFILWMPIQAVSYYIIRIITFSTIVVLQNKKEKISLKDKSLMIAVPVWFVFK